VPNPRHRSRVIRIVICPVIYAALMSLRPEVTSPVARTLMATAAGVAIGYAMLVALLIARERGRRPWR